MRSYQGQAALPPVSPFPAGCGAQREGYARDDDRDNQEPCHRGREKTDDAQVLPQHVEAARTEEEEGADDCGSGDECRGKPKKDWERIRAPGRIPSPGSHRQAGGGNAGKKRASPEKLYPATFLVHVEILCCESIPERLSEFNRC